MMFSAAAIKAQSPIHKLVFIGAHVAVLLVSKPTFQPDWLDFVCCHEFDYTCRELAEGSLGSRSPSNRDRAMVTSVQIRDRELIHDWGRHAQRSPIWRSGSRH